MDRLDRDLKKQEEKLRKVLNKHGFIETTMGPDYLGSFTNGHATLVQFYKWVGGKYMIRVGADYPKIFAIQEMTYNIIFYNGAHFWGRFPDITAVLSDDFVQPIINFAEKEYNFYNEKEKK